MKEVTIQIRLPESEKEAFARLVKSKDSTISRELRQFIRDQLKKNQQQELFK